MLKPKILLFLIGAVLFSACVDDVDQEVPVVPVSISLDINTELASLGIGSTMICPKNGGYMGIIIYRHTLSDYYAFERTCSYYPNDTSAVEVNNGEIIVSCPKCGSKFILTPDGALVNQGPARLPLVQYRTYLSGSNRLFISN